MQIFLVKNRPNFFGQKLSKYFCKKFIQIFFQKSLQILSKNSPNTYSYSKYFCTILLWRFQHKLMMRFAVIPFTKSRKWNNCKKQLFVVHFKCQLWNKKALKPTAKQSEGLLGKKENSSKMQFNYVNSEQMKTLRTENG